MSDEPIRILNYDGRTDISAIPRPFIGTHNGRFHVDEVMACYMLTRLKDQPRVIVRTRDEDLLSQAEVLVDVGNEYDHSRKRYDHHQRDFNEYLYPNSPSVMSSAGLIYKHYGRRVILSELESLGLATPDDRVLEDIYEMVYLMVITTIDAGDNGVARFGNNQANYRDCSDLASRVSHLFPSWAEPEVDETERFADAMAMAGDHLRSVIRIVTISIIPAREAVKQAVVRSMGQEYLQLDQWLPYTDSIYELEEGRENIPGCKFDKKFKFAVYPSAGGTRWTVRAIPHIGMNFVSRGLLPKAWRGLRKNDLVRVSGIKTASFVHNEGFIGVTGNEEDAIKMVKAGLECS